MSSLDDDLPSANSPQPNNRPDWVRILNSRRSRAIAFAVGAATGVVKLLATLIDLFCRHRE
jgi:hypothetical protein